ncbi:MAG: HTH-type transcriptional regulator ImmR [Firmicutes bacterium ADurb.Bin419]|nr:MAG: HTH-type transcriptional regulator ImmR [Firmicutes bacterium ADurb.Bin419]
MSFGNNLKLLRKEKGLTQEQLADMLDVSRQAVSKWESDNGYPETDKLLIIAKELGVSLDYLMDNAPKEVDVEENTEVNTKSDNKLMITMFDGSQVINCLSVKYSKMIFTAKNEPAYILQAIDRVGFFGAHTAILGWYEDESSVKKELDAIMEAMNRGDKIYKLQSQLSHCKFVSLALK